MELASTHKYLHANLERSIDNVALINVDKESYGNVTKFQECESVKFIGNAPENVGLE